MSNVRLNLIVLYSPDIERLRAFYTLLGLEFEQEQHERGPLHYAAQAGEATIEIYPQQAKSSADVGAVRLGFDVVWLDAVLDPLIENGAALVTPPQDTLRGIVAVIRDPDGRKIELVESRPRRRCCG
jgi:lactoylglutathione lyase